MTTSDVSCSPVTAEISLGLPVTAVQHTTSSRADIHGDQIRLLLRLGCHIQGLLILGPSRGSPGRELRLIKALGVWVVLVLLVFSLLSRVEVEVV